MTNYRRNHYVPIWYQKRFLDPQAAEAKFRYLDLVPEVVLDSHGTPHRKTDVKRWGPKLCFVEDDLYTTQLGPWVSTEIEERFFGPVDDAAPHALDYWTAPLGNGVNREAFHMLLRHMVLQKLRTPKGLAFLAEQANSGTKNATLMALQKFDYLYAAIWTEAEWAIADASNSETKFLLSDHPVTVYNLRCFPGSKWCQDFHDPEPWRNGTHTLFPLSRNKLLILTNTSWIKNPYGNPMASRPNPSSRRSAVFNFQKVQTGRQLSEGEVIEINYVIKKRAKRFIAASNEEWLYPERKLTSTHWSKFGDGLLFMPDPREVSFTGQVIFGGYSDGRPADIWDEYGRQPGQRGYQDRKRQDKEWVTAEAFKGEFARIFGPKYRGSSNRTGRRDSAVEDSPEYHALLLKREKPELSKSRRRR